ncbi:MAG: stage III sporulation protein AG [Firmicutes bacterium]|nr:stage III sporulation protein AG [Bacillota bacterium]
MGRREQRERWRREPFWEMWRERLRQRFGVGEAAYRRLQAAVVVVGTGLILLLVANGLGAGSSSPPAAAPPAASPPSSPGGSAGATGAALPADPNAAAEVLAQRLEATLSDVRGAGRVRVEVTLESGPRNLYLMEEHSQTSTTQETDSSGGRRQESQSDRQLTLPSSATGGSPPVAAVDEPQVRGVLVVASGAGDPEVRDELARAVQTLLGVPLYRVAVVAGDP